MRAIKVRRVLIWGLLLLTVLFMIGGVLGDWFGLYGADPITRSYGVAIFLLSSIACLWAALGLFILDSIEMGA